MSLLAAVLVVRSPQRSGRRKSAAAAAASAAAAAQVANNAAAAGGGGVLAASPGRIFPGGVVRGGRDQAQRAVGQDLGAAAEPGIAAVGGGGELLPAHAQERAAAAADVPELWGEAVQAEDLPPRALTGAATRACAKRAWTVAHDPIRVSPSESRYPSRGRG